MNSVMDFLRKLFFKKKEVIVQPIIIEEVKPPIPKKKRPTILIMDECSTKIPWNEARKRMNLNRKD
jgi:hypothetical protein